MDHIIRSIKSDCIGPGCTDCLNCVKGTCRVDGTSSCGSEDAYGSVCIRVTKREVRLDNEEESARIVWNCSDESIIACLHVVLKEK